jgi:transcriptional regulator with XRE-family HTH domain
MTKNRISRLRKARDLTQRALAEKVGTSQQQIQRIEAGVVTVRLDQAVKVASALGASLGEAFPDLAKLENGAVRRRTSASAVDRVLSKTGIDADPAQWTIKFFMCDGRQFFYQVSSLDKDRLESIVRDSDKRFLVFNSVNKLVALNATKIGACQFLFDAFVSENDEEDDEEFRMDVHFISSKECVTFDVDPDEADPLKDDFGVRSQLQYLFTSLDGADDEVVSFYDADNECVYLRTKELLLLEAPLVCCAPALWEKSQEEFREEEDIQDHLRKSKESKT